MNLKKMLGLLFLFLILGVKTQAKTTFFPSDLIVDEVQVADPNLKDQWYLNRINAPLFWQKSTGSQNVKVLVCDTGIDSNHPDLKGNISLPGHNFVDDSTNTEPTGNPHGTRVAGIIGARANNGVGGVGVAWQVQIVPGKISNAANGAADHVNTAKCIRWGADQGIKIVNVSYSGTNDNPDIAEAAKYLRSKGGVLLVSAGNEGQKKDFADNPNIIAVSAINDIDWKPPWSNSGDYVDLVAPGSNITTTDFGGGYMTGKGCSFAVAVASGAAALMLSVRPDMTGDQLSDLILHSVDHHGDPGKNPAFGNGILNLQKSLDLLQAM